MLRHISHTIDRNNFVIILVPQVKASFDLRSIVYKKALFVFSDTFCTFADLHCNAAMWKSEDPFVYSCVGLHLYKVYVCRLCVFVCPAYHY